MSRSERAVATRLNEASGAIADAADDLARLAEFIVGPPPATLEERYIQARRFIAATAAVSRARDLVLDAEAALEREGDDQELPQ